MKQKQKIIIFLTSLFCGSPIIFFILRNNHQEKNEQKNKLFIKKKEKENNKDHQKASSSLFWIILIVILVISVILLWRIYKYIQKPENKEQKQQHLLEEKKPFRCYLSLSAPKSPCFNIFLFSNKLNIDINKSNQKTINNVLTAEFDELANIAFQEQAKSCKETLTKILQESTNYISTYLTGQLLYDVYQEIQTSKKDYGILSNMSKLLDFNTKYTKGEVVYKESFTENINVQEATAEDLTYINQNKPLDLLSTVIQHEKIIFTKYKDKEDIEQKCFLFRRFFVIYKLIDRIHLQITQFFQDQITKNNKQEEYKKLLKSIQISKKNIEELFPEKIN